MNLKTLMSSMGTNVTRDLEPQKFISVVSSCPVITQNFPQLGTMASNMQTALNGYDSLLTQLDELKSTIESTEDKIDSTQSAVNKAQEALTGTISLQPGIGMVTNLTTGEIKPTGGFVPYQTAITTVNNLLEEAKKLLKSLKDQLVKLEESIKEYYNRMIEQIKGYITEIVNTKVN